MMEDMLPPDHSLRIQRALLALEGLSLGDAFGECFFDSSVVLAALGATRTLPTAPWNYTDDTEMALAIAHTPDGPTRQGLLKARALPKGCSVDLAVSALGSGSRVLSWDTVPFALWCVAQQPDEYQEAMWRTVSGLGDRDTTCAMAGGIVALVTGRDGLPASWLAAREPLAMR